MELFMTTPPPAKSGPSRQYRPITWLLLANTSRIAASERPAAAATLAVISMLFALSSQEASGYGLCA